ncbi:MAG TPA: YjbH domain-containing protein [Candidatus Saccharimonadales bacterium]|nr:YjbH domain-containing protein [Candidatus Saccharimonadales bacterium]
MRARCALAGAALLGVLGLLAAVPAASGASAPAPDRAAAAAELAAGLADRGFESVQVSAADSVCRVRLENRRFRDPGFAFGVIAALADAACPGPCEVVLLRQGVPVARVDFRSSDAAALAAGRLAQEAFAADLAVETLPDVGPQDGSVLSPAVRRVDLSPRFILDSQFGHIEEPLVYHVEIAPEIATQPWAGALLRLGWTFPIHHERDIQPGDLHPDYDRSRPEEAALYQFRRLGHRVLASLAGGYFGLNRYGLSAGLGLASGARWYLDASADLTGSLAFLPDVSYSGLKRVTFAGAATFRPGGSGPPDLAFTLRGGRYLYGAVAGSGVGEYAVRAEVARRFQQLEIGFFVVKSESNHYGGLRLSLPLPPAVRLRPGPVRLDLPAAFPAEYRTEEALFEVQPVDPRLRAALLDDLWRTSVVAQLDQWVAGYRYARQGVAEGTP